MEKTKSIIFRIAAAILAVYMTLLFMICAEAHPKINEKHTTASGETFIIIKDKMQTGWTYFGGAKYYCHKTESLDYPRGSVYAGGFKQFGKQWFCFDSEGRCLTHSTKCVKLDRKGNVAYIYPAGMEDIRFCTGELRFQEYRNGKWVSVGMQVVPANWKNTQK